MAFCVDCGTILERSGQPCPACGRGLPSSRKSCVQCGHATGTKDSFCAKCGSRLPEPEAPLEFDSAVEAKLQRLSGASERGVERRVQSSELRARVAAPRGAATLPGPPSAGSTRDEASGGPDWVPPWLNRLSYARLVWAGLLGVVLTVVADVLRTFSDGWLVESRELSSGIWVVRDEVKYSLGETFQNLAFFLRALGVLLAFVATMLILLRAMRKTLVGKGEP